MRSRSLLVIRALAGAGAAPALFAGDNSTSKTQSSSFNTTKKNVFTRNHNTKNALCEAARTSVRREDEHFVSTMNHPVLKWFFHSEGVPTAKITEPASPRRLFTFPNPSHASTQAAGPHGVACPPSSQSSSSPFSTSNSLPKFSQSCSRGPSASSSPPSTDPPCTHSALVSPSLTSATPPPPPQPQSLPRPVPQFTTFITTPQSSSTSPPPFLPPPPPSAAPSPRLPPAASALSPSPPYASSPTNSRPSPPSSYSPPALFPTSSSLLKALPPTSPPPSSTPPSASPSSASSPSPSDPPAFPWASLPRPFSRLAHWRNYFFLKSQSFTLRCGLTGPPSSQQQPAEAAAATESACSEQQRQQEQEKRGRWQRSRKRRPRVVIVGGGWGAVSFLNCLDLRKYDVLLISPRNYFNFTPLLPAVSVGTLPDAACETAVRTLLVRGGKTLASFCEATVVDVNPQRRTVVCCAGSDPTLHQQQLLEQQRLLQQGQSAASDGIRFWEEEYDYLVLAVGAEVNTFNIPGVSAHSIFLKEAEDARKLRHRIFDLLESAALPHRSAAEKRRLLHFVVVGGGPTGVEVAAELSDFLQEEGRKYYPALSPFFKVSLVEMLPTLLTMYSPEIQQFALENFRQNSIVDVRLQTVVTAVEADAVHLKTVAPVVSLSSLQKTTNGATRSGTPAPNAVAVAATNNTTANAAAVGNATATARSNGAVTTAADGIERIPCGVVVWASGIKSPELCTRLKNKTTPTAALRGPPVLLVNPQLRVGGTEDIFALGDCSRIAPPRLIDYAEALYASGVAAAQHEGDQYPSIDWVKKQAPKLSARFPQLSPKSRAFAEKMEKFSDQPLTPDTFRKLLTELDGMYVPPAPTAQNAKQQGEYLALVFNSFHLAEDKKLKAPAFQAHNRGALVYLGNGAAAVDFPPAAAAFAPLLALGSVTHDNVNSSESSNKSSTSEKGGHCWTGGLHTLFLWRMAYTSMQLTWGGAAACVLGWLRTALEGRPLYREKLHIGSYGPDAVAAPVAATSAVIGSVGSKKPGSSDNNDKQQ